MARYILQLGSGELFSPNRYRQVKSDCPTATPARRCDPMSVLATAHTRQTDIRPPTTHTNPKIRPPAPHASQPVRDPSRGSLRCTPWPSLARRNWLLRALPMAQRTLRTPHPTPSGKNTARNPAGANPANAATSPTCLPSLAKIPHLFDSNGFYTTKRSVKWPRQRPALTSPGIRSTRTCRRRRARTK